MKAAESLIAALVVAPVLLGQQPQIENARLETRQVAGGLDATLRAIVNLQSSPAWVGYTEPILPGDRQLCCWNDSVRGCFLEAHTTTQSIAGPANPTVKLEGPTHVVVLLRVEEHRIGKIRALAPECELDGGGLPFIWLTGASPSESIQFLSGVAQDTAGGARDQLRRADAAVAAIALHAAPDADRTLEALASAPQPEQVRKQAIFWMGTTRGKRGFEIVSRIVREDPSDRIREHAVFALTQNKEPEAMNAVVRAAHDDKSPRVRGQALFWLAQRAAQKTAESAIAEAIANDPETEVKKKALFALTQVPLGEGTPLLIQVARTSPNAALRKQAMFWLGQSKDPRALAYIEEVLK